MGRTAEVNTGVTVDTDAPEFSSPPRVERDPARRGGQTVLDDDGLADHRSKITHDAAFRDFAVQVPDRGTVDVSVAPRFLPQGARTLSADQVSQILATHGGVVTFHQDNQIQVSSNDQARTPYMTLHSDDAKSLASIFHEIGTLWERRFGNSPARRAQFEKGLAGDAKGTSFMDGMQDIDPYQYFSMRLSHDGMMVIDAAHREAIVKQDPARTRHDANYDRPSAVRARELLPMPAYNHVLPFADGASFSRFLGNTIYYSIMAYQSSDRW